MGKSVTHILLIFINSKMYLDYSYLREVFRGRCRARRSSKERYHVIPLMLEGPGIGVEDTMFMTNEEWTSYSSDHVVGISAFALNAATKELWAVGVFGPQDMGKPPPTTPYAGTFGCQEERGQLLWLQFLGNQHSLQGASGDRGRS